MLQLGRAFLAMAASVSYTHLDVYKRQVLSTAFALVLGLPLGVLLVAGDKDGVLPLPGWLMHTLNIIINILRSVPFLILMICVFPLTRAIVGTTVGTTATIVPLVVAAFPFVARLVETSLRELDEGVVEAAQSMGATPFQIIDVYKRQGYEVVLTGDLPINDGYVYAAVRKAQ